MKIIMERQNYNNCIVILIIDIYIISTIIFDLKLTCGKFLEILTNEIRVTKCVAKWNESNNESLLGV